MKGNFLALALVVVGCLALAVNLDLLEIDIVALLRKWWPLGLVALGLALYLTPDGKDHKD